MGKTAVASFAPEVGQKRAPHANPPTPEPLRKEGGGRVALRLTFELAASSYATMLVRELLRQPLEPSDQKQRSKAALVDVWDKTWDVDGARAAERKRWRDGAAADGDAGGEQPAQRTKV